MLAFVCLPSLAKPPLRRPDRRRRGAALEIGMVGDEALVELMRRVDSELEIIADYARVADRSMVIDEFLPRPGRGLLAGQQAALAPPAGDDALRARIPDDAIDEFVKHPDLEPRLTID